MKLDLNIAASDVEPGTIVFSIVIDGNTDKPFTIPLRGEHALQFALKMRDAYAMAFRDQLPKELQPIGELIEQVARGE